MKTTMARGRSCVVLLLISVSMGLISVAARAASPGEVRAITGIKKFPDASGFVAAFYTSAPGWTRGQRLEIALGRIQRGNDRRLLLSVGPAWRWELPRRPLFIETSFSPTLLHGSRFGNRDMGGNLHFTTSLAVGARFGVSRALTLRLQHISNGGLNSQNPGMDLVGVTYVHRLFGD